MTDVDGESVPERGCGNGKGPVTPGPELGPWDYQAVGVRGPEVTGGGVVAEEVREVGGSKVVQSFEGREKYFEVYPVFNREPVEVMKDGGDVFSAAGGGEQAGGGILNVLKFIEDFVG